jgi:hypothetical protein
MKKIGIVLSIILVISASCLAKKKTVVKKPPLTYVQMGRTPCFGRCPTYSIEIWNTGKVRYSGYMFTNHQGVYEKNIGQAKAIDFLNRFYAYRPDTCQDAYTVMISDIPGVNYQLEVNGDGKTILNAHYGPDFLKTFAGTIDREFAVDKTWKKVADTAMRHR